MLIAGACASDASDARSSSGTQAHDEKGQKQYLPLFQIATKSEDPKTTLDARFAAAGVDTKIRAARDVPADHIPAWMRGKDGWIVYVASEHRPQAEAVWEAWLESRGAVEERRPAKSQPTLTLGAAKPLPPRTVASIQAELQQRRRIDQEVRRDPKRRDQMQQVDRDNTAWLKDTVVANGWIDVGRFGRKAADSAFLLVQHSSDLPLMNAALPHIERDVKSGRLSAQNFALLFDRLQIIQGGLQRYGTQVMQGSQKGDWVVGRLEDPDRVDERRKEIGLEPLQDYLSRFEGKVRVDR